MSEDAGTKQCPQCAEEVLAAARLCRYCGYRFDLAAVEGEPLPLAPAAPSQASPPSPTPGSAAPLPSVAHKRSRLAIVLTVLAIVVLLIVALLAAAAYLNRKSLDEKEMAYVARFVQEDYKDSEYYMLGSAMAAARQSAALNGRRPTAAALAKAQRFFREGDAYFRRLQALKSPSQDFDETHAAWQREVDLERRCLAAVRTWFNDPWGDKGSAASRTATRLSGRATKAGDIAWDLFADVMRDEASSQQLTEVSRLQAKYKREMKED